jgi:peptidyl-prolyl cis-trans isomerase C
MNYSRAATPNESQPKRAHPWGALSALLLSALLLGCQPQDPGQDQPLATESGKRTDQAGDIAGDGESIASVNGRPITVAAFEHYLAQKQSSSTKPVDPGSVLNEMINIELLSASAEDAGYDRRESVRLELERQRKGLLANVALQERLNAVEISQDEVEVAYRERYVDADNTEYQASHILVESKEKAQDLIAQLQQGADFAELARENSVGPSASRGGDLGWFSASDVVPEFAQAVVALDNGAYTREPVQSKFGWHVIKRMDSRTPEPPELAEVEDELRRTLTARSVADYLRGLREAAQIEVKEQAQ